MTNRGKEWVDFQMLVLKHVEDYTVPQYGDMPGDNLSKFTMADIKTQMTRYVSRIGTNARGRKEALRDCLKMAHYACALHAKIVGAAKE